MLITFRCILAAAVAVLASSSALLSQTVGRRLDGFNVIMAPGHPFGAPSTARALIEGKRLGATAIAIVPFLWQPTTASADIVRGTDMDDRVLRLGIRQARALGFSVVVKPHVWVPESWAGAVEPDSEEAWHAWFARYRAELELIARIADEEQADALAIGTELAKTTRRPEWIGLIATARTAFRRTLLYIAHNAEEAEAIPFWNLLDAIGVSLYPPLGADRDRVHRLVVMQTSAERLDALAARTSKPIFVGEIGLRSAEGAAAKPWESAEERVAVPDPLLQAEVLADWLAVLDRPTIRGVLIWRWLTDPGAGGLADTDFTVQGKPAEGVLLCAWKSVCPRR
jgi:hypothetical protein